MPLRQRPVPDWDVAGRITLRDVPRWSGTTRRRTPCATDGSSVQMICCFETFTATLAACKALTPAPHLTLRTGLAAAVASRASVLPSRGPDTPIVFIELSATYPYPKYEPFEGIYAFCDYTVRTNDYLILQAASALPQLTCNA